MLTGSEQVKLGISFVCPACKGALRHSHNAYCCVACDRQYPILYGIPDFRLRSDRYLTLEQEREKAGQLDAFAQSASFEELVAYYYTITDDVPPELASRYQAYIHSAPDQARSTVAKLNPDPKCDILLDLGCGAGGLLVTASGCFKQVVGLDIALRWLIICKKRLDELGENALLVCADIEHPPFNDGEYSHVVAADLIEHVHNTKTAIEQCWKQLEPGGHFWLSATNRYCIGPHPLTRIWGIGFLQQAARSAILIKIRGVDSLRFTNLVSPAAIKKLCQQTGFHLLEVLPRQLSIDNIAKYPRHDRILIRCYTFMLRFSLFRGLLVYAGPAFQISCKKS